MSAHRKPKMPTTIASSGHCRSAAAKGWEIRQSGTLKIVQVPALSKLSWVVHGFSTRAGGASELNNNRAEPNPGKRESGVLNLGYTDWDSREKVSTNRARFFCSIDAERMRVVTLKQIHSDIVHCVSGQESAQGMQGPAADALITNQRGILLAVQTADCVPILLADVKTRAIAAIHSGWRGTARRIAEKTLGRMQIEFGTRPQDVIAAIGPAIGRCCYEVGSEVVREFHSQFSDAQSWFEGPFDSLATGENDPNWLPWLTMMPPGHQLAAPKARLDLAAANRAILIGAGVPSSQIGASGFCTFCRTDLFFSYRKERVTGRLMAALGIR